MINRHQRSRDFADPAAPCPLCDGECFVQIFAHTGEQTSYAVACPHCLGFGKVAPDHTLEAGRQ